MKLSNFAKTGAALALALGMAAPVVMSSSPASAAPHMDAMHDHGHRPPPRAEHRPPQPHGNYRWRAGSYAWQGDHWGWTPGIWIKPRSNLPNLLQ